VTWKSLKGDNADNIAGFSGIGDKRAEKLVRNPENLIAFLSESPERKEKFQLNHELIRFHDMSDQMTEVQFLGPVSFIWEDVKTQFEEMDFKSITKDPAWTKFSGTFANLS
jgi:5'-3' exonuclease